MSNGLRCRFVVTASNETIGFNFDHAYLIAKDDLAEFAPGSNEWVYNGDFEMPIDRLEPERNFSSMPSLNIVNIRSF